MAKFANVQSCAYKFGQPLFQDSEETIHSTEINTTSYESPWFCSLRKNKKTKFFEKPNNQKLKKQKTKQTSFSGLRQFSKFFVKISGIGPWMCRID